MTDWTSIQRELKNRAPLPGAAAPEAFWADFKARAKLTNQDALAVQPARRTALWASLASAACAALLLLAFWPSPATAEITQVTSLEIGPAHTGAMILNVVSQNGRESGAIVWISGLEEPHD